MEGLDLIDFQTLFAALPSPYMVLDENWNLVAANIAYQAVVKMPAADLVGRHLFDLFPNEGEEGDRLRKSLRSVFETGRSDSIAFIPYAIPKPDSEGGGIEMRYWSAVHTPLKNADGRTVFVLQNTVDVTELVARSPADAAQTAMETTGGVHVLQRARELEKAYKDTLAESAEFRRLFDQAPGMIAVLDGKSHVFSFANDAYRRFTGRHDLEGRSVRELFPEMRGQGLIDLLDTVFETGETQRGEGVRVFIKPVDGDGMREAFIDFHFQPIRNLVGAITGIFVQGTDRTDQYRTMHRQRLLLDELNHRVKNTLSTVQSIARRSFKRIDSEGMASFEARIKALSNVHDLISDQHWERISLETLLNLELGAFGESRLVANGPKVDLTPRAAIALAMVFHELASNALKYGPLADDDGSLAVAWTVPPQSGARDLVLEWREQGNRSAPGRWERGFGMKTLERIVEGELGGSLTLDLDADGFICRCRMALEEVGEVADGGRA